MSQSPSALSNQSLKTTPEQPEETTQKSPTSNEQGNSMAVYYELQRKLQAAGHGTIATAAHPGWTATNLQQHASAFDFLNRFFAQNAEMGALPTLYAATAPDVQGGDYFGPSKRFEMIGYPKKVSSNDRSHDTAVAAKLWQLSEEMTGMSFSI